MLTRLLSYLAMAILWLLHFLPLSLLAVIGQQLGVLFMVFAKRRRKIAVTNLSWCFPELDPASLSKLVKAHFRILGRSGLERSLLWWASEKRLMRLIKVNGEEKITARLNAGKPVIFFAPHFSGLDAGGLAMAMRFSGVSIYSTQRYELFDRIIFKSRSRFNDQLLLSRQDGVRATVKAIRNGRPFYYLPDMDFGSHDSIFVPFFGIQTATITGLSRLSRLTGAAILPCITRILPGNQGYVVDIGDAWDDFPTDDVVADTRRMNAFIEETIRTMPEQYHWVHRRFKTRPEGEAYPY